MALVLPAAALAQQGVPGLHFIENWDLDGDGQVTLAEATEKRGEIFFMFDQDENGALDATEYDLFDETRQADMDANAGGHGNGPMRGVNEGMMRAFNDADGDGTVTRDEFLARVADWFAMMDRSGDGVVTTDDFGPRG
jgi:Ca2+-binding EF-hand superfamily protein